MNFPDLLKRFTAAVEAGEGRATANCFTEDGVYHDYIYGAFEGREAIRNMVEDYFYRDAKDYIWEMFDHVSDDKIGYASYRFSFTSTMPQFAGKRVVMEGICRFEIGKDGLLRKYSESVNGGIAMSQLGVGPEKMAEVFARLAQKLRTRKEFKDHL